MKPLAKRSMAFVQPKTSLPGLFFVGMPFQFGLTSQLLCGAARDAGYVAIRVTEGVVSGALSLTAP